MSATEQNHLRRTLRLWDLILYGVIVIQPTAPMSVYGVLSNRGRGHVVTTILIALVAMLFTAISYGRMARAYPSAGSAFTYVGQEINPALGYITGWSMVMDYMLNPMICIVWVSQQAHQFAPAVPYWGWAVFFALLFTGLNLQGIRTSARMNAGLAGGMGVVIAIFFVCAARYIFGHPHSGVDFFTRPFYDPATFSSGAVLGGAPPGRRRCRRRPVRRSGRRHPRRCLPCCAARSPCRGARSEPRRGLPPGPRSRCPYGRWSCSTRGTATAPGTTRRGPVPGKWGRGRGRAAGGFR